MDKVAQIRAAGAEAYAYSYAPTHTAAQLSAEFSDLENGAEDEMADVAVAGRIMTRRIMGKLAFFTIHARGAVAPGRCAAGRPRRAAACARRSRRVWTVVLEGGV